MLATLYGRALDSERPESVLHDDAAKRAVERIDYDFGKTGMTTTTAVGVAIRARVLDDWTREFIARHPSCTVLHLACGLDTRAHRLERPETVRWVDVDMPDVVALRRRILPEPAGDYALVASSVTEDAWLDAVPADRPVVAVFEGLSMYLTREEGHGLVRRITGRFAGGELLFDVYGSWGIKLQKLVPAVRNAGATLHWGVDDPREVEALHPGLTTVDSWRSVDLPHREALPGAGRVQLKVVGAIPKLRDVGKLLRLRW
ncbi:O-Methyltransferase involved in polyketide biosynthesis [Lentzea fradiae]|uniref:O-Methyltransferase involved in polyketide biosynthesis n=2 Tax=Lentzea fradiae TaxID=200378 RepID=A0A1G8BVR7_9PSEU|nr:O-Methyltransferase involved in polyketide biosynthesis [Lentzea fradiae]